jgi:ethanolamine utilization cobalamin adenosyltransferase
MHALNSTLRTYIILGKDITNIRKRIQNPHEYVGVDESNVDRKATCH